jgi:hypothetical protein
MRDKARKACYAADQQVKFARWPGFDEDDAVMAWTLLRDRRGR